jgi:hypothetical protein
MEYATRCDKSRPRVIYTISILLIEEKSAYACAACYM